MIQNSFKKAFTLVEVMVWIAIIGIIAFWVSQFNFNAISQKQEIEIDIAKLVNNYEEIRNNALVGKAVDNGGTLEAARAWRMRITTAWAFTADYSLDGTFASPVSYDSLSWDINPPADIISIECQRLNGSNGSVIPSWWASIEFRWSEMELRCNSATYDSKDKLLLIEYGTPTSSKTVTINTLSGIIEVD